MLIRLTRRALRDRLVLTPETLNEQQLDALRAPLVRNGTSDERKTGDRRSHADTRLATKELVKEPDWPADMPARVPTGSRYCPEANPKTDRGRSYRQQGGCTHHAMDSGRVQSGKSLLLNDVAA
jgi:hypothetical protein